MSENICYIRTPTKEGDKVSLRQEAKGGRVSCRLFCASDASHDSLQGPSPMSGRNVNEVHCYTRGMPFASVTS